MTVSDNTTQAENLGSLFKNLVRSSAKGGKKIATNVLKSPGRALESSSNIATADATNSPSAGLSSVPEMISFYHTSKGLYLGKLVSFMLHQWTIKNKNCTQLHYLKLLI